MNPASMLGKMAKGVPKKYSPEEIAKRTDRIKDAQKKRAKKMREVISTENKTSEYRCEKNEH